MKNLDRAPQKIPGLRGTECQASLRDFLQATAVGAQTFEPRPVKIQAVKMQDAFTVKTLEGVMTAQPGDYLVVGLEGELYPCAARIFEKKYRKVEG